MHKRFGFAFITLLFVWLVVTTGHSQDTFMMSPSAMAGVGPTDTAGPQSVMVPSEASGGGEFIPQTPASAPESPWDSLRNIFNPPNTKPQEKKKAVVKVVTNETTVRLPILNGIMIGSDKDRVAVIGGEFLRVGDFVDGFVVRRIRKQSVLLVREGKESVLYVKQ